MEEGHVTMGYLFFPRGGAAYVARYLTPALVDAPVAVVNRPEDRADRGEHALEQARAELSWHARVARFEEVYAAARRPERACEMRRIAAAGRAVCARRAVGPLSSGVTDGRYRDTVSSLECLDFK